MPNEYKILRVKDWLKYKSGGYVINKGKVYKLEFNNPFQGLVLLPFVVSTTEPKM